MNHAHSDDLAAGVALAMKGDVNAHGPQRRLSASQATSERARGSGPVRTKNRHFVTLDAVGSPQEV